MTYDCIKKSLRSRTFQRLTKNNYLNYITIFKKDKGKN